MYLHLDAINVLLKYINIPNGGADGSGYSFFLRSLRRQMRAFAINKYIYTYIYLPKISSAH